MAKSPVTGSTPKAPRVVKPRTYWLVADGFTSEELKGANLRIVTSTDEILAMQDAAMESGAKFGRAKLTLPQGKPRKKAEG